MTFGKNRKGSFFAAVLVVTIFSISNGLAEVTCPSSVNIEEGSTAIVSCNIEEKQIIRVYWYMGDTAKTNPILRLENGKPGGTLYGTTHYNISTSGAMIVRNAQILHEALYTTFIYFHDGTSESKSIMVNITISPWHSCPLIDTCVPCEECIMTANGTGKLKCTTSGVRPVITLEWMVKTQNGVSIVKYPVVITKDLMSDTWNSSVEISFEISSCNQEANIQCVAQDHLNLLENPISSVRIYSVNCTTDNIPGSSRINVITVVVICVVTIATVVLVICVFKNWQRYTSARQKEHILATHLKEKYNISTIFQPLTCGNIIDVRDLYVACQCKVTYKNGDTTFISTEKLLRSNVIMDETCVLITGDTSYWDSVFIKPCLQQWIQSDYNDFILLFIKRREIKLSMRVIDVLQEELQINSNLLAKCIRNKKCILLLHGLAKIIFDVEKKSLGQFPEVKRSNDGTSFQSLTFSRLFERSGECSSTQIHIWITMWNKCPTADIFPWGHTKITVYKVDQRQFDELITKICHGKIKPNGKFLSENYLDYSSNISQTENQDFQESVECEILGQDYLRLLSPEESHGKPKSIEIQNKLHSIKAFVEKNRFYAEFKEFPIALSIIAHTVINKDISHTADYTYGKIPSKEEIICTLVYYLTEAYLLLNGNQNVNLDVDESLGTLALHLIDTQSECVDTHTSVLSDCEGDFQMAMEVGLLKHQKYMSSSQEPGNRTEASFPYCIRFPNSSFKFYFAAQTLVRNGFNYTETLVKYDTPNNFPVFEFMMHLTESPIKHLLGVFQKFKTYDDVINYLYKWDNQNGVKKVTAELEWKELKFTRLNEQEQENAFASMCEKCRDMKINLKSISISGIVSISFLTSLDLPNLDELRFLNMTVEENRLLTILQWLSTKDMVLRFHVCKVPKTFSEAIQKEIRKLRNIKVKTVLQRDEGEDTVFLLNYKNTSWEKEDKCFVSENSNK